VPALNEPLPSAEQRGWFFRRRRLLSLILLLTAAGALIAFGAVALRIADFDPRLRGNAPLDAVIVLGAAAYGSRPSPVFAGRLDYAAELLRSGRAHYAIVTGGGRDDPTHPESIVGAAYLRGLGLDPARVLNETRSINTLENLCYAAAAGAEQRLHTYAIVSDPTHLARAMLLAQDIGLPAVPAATPYTRFRSWHARALFLARESYQYGKRLLLGAQPCPSAHASPSSSRCAVSQATHATAPNSSAAPSGTSQTPIPGSPSYVAIPPRKNPSGISTYAPFNSRDASVQRRSGRAKRLSVPANPICSSDSPAPCACASVHIRRRVSLPAPR
jgi:uncharacterized SAM-binding protein YcdF (DUF218 family)